MTEDELDEDSSQDTNDSSGSEAIDEARFKLRSTKHADAVVRELAQEDYQRPADLLPKVQETNDISRSNLYNLLSRLNGTLVEKVDGPGRATLYTLTDAGKTVANEFGLTATAEFNEQEDAVIRIAEESATEAIWEVMQHKNLTCGDLEDLILPKLRAREQDLSDGAQASDQQSMPEQEIER